ncbi:Elongator complex protein 5 [Platanthera zijinensis]|uniref:Elongator complex protein 5 n=1 Tax=Platanthera zijinensis TaxID=2320716 RepID=A0AAP0BLA0_9ASPA
MAESICKSLRDGALEGEHSPALTIKDSLESLAGAHAFNYFLRSLAANVSTGKSQARGLVLVAFNQSPSSYLSLLNGKGLDASVLRKFLRILDCYSDPLGWKENILQSGGHDKPTLKESDNVCRDVKDVSKLLSLILELGKGFAGEGKTYFAVAIDSISTMLRYASLQLVAGFISNIRSQGQVSCMIWLLHTDLHEARSAAVLEYVSSIVASLEPMVQTTEGKRGSENLFCLGRNSQNGRFHVRLKRRNGRVKLLNEEFHMDQDGISFTALSSENVVVSQTRLPKLQFNLLLSEKERDDRARVVLPFEHQGMTLKPWLKIEHRLLTKNSSSSGSRGGESQHKKTCLDDRPHLAEVHFIRELSVCSWDSHRSDI